MSNKAIQAIGRGDLGVPAGIRPKVVVLYADGTYGLFMSNEGAEASRKTRSSHKRTKYYSSSKWLFQLLRETADDYPDRDWFNTWTSGESQTKVLNLPPGAGKTVTGNGLRVCELAAISRAPDFIVTEEKKE